MAYLQYYDATGRSSKIKGIDISHWQYESAGVYKGFDFTKAYAAGARFVYMKAGGTINSATRYLVDKSTDGIICCSQANVAAARAAGLKVGFYFFKDPTHNTGWYNDPADAITEATKFYEYVKNACPAANDFGDLVPILDFENPADAIVPTISITDDQCYDYIAQFATTLKQLSGVSKVGLYTAYYTLDGLDATAGNELVHSTKGSVKNVCPILWWAANISTTTSASNWNLTACGGYTKWDIWQYSSDVDKNGAALTYGAAAAGDMDLNVIEGTLASISLETGGGTPIPTETLRYFTINGKASTDWGIVTQIDRPMMPPLSLNTVDIPLRAGSYVTVKNPQNTKSRTFTISVFVNGPADITTLRSTQRSIAAYFKNLNIDGTFKRLSFSDEPTRAYDVWTDGEIAWEMVNATCGVFTVTLVAAMPYAIDPTLKTISFSGTSASVTYAGTAETFPTIRYTFSSSRSGISFTFGSKTITVNRSFVAGDTLVIDCSRSLVYLSPSTSIMPNLDITSRFFSFQPSSSNTILVNAAVYSSATVEYYERHV